MTYDFNIQDVRDELDYARENVAPVLSELDARKADHGHIHFHDVVEAVAMFVDVEENPARFEAMKRVAECERIITIHDSEYV